MSAMFQAASTKAAPSSTTAAKNTIIRQIQVPIQMLEAIIKNPQSIEHGKYSFLQQELKKQCEGKTKEEIMTLQNEHRLQIDAALTLFGHPLHISTVPEKMVAARAQARNVSDILAVDPQLAKPEYQYALETMLSVREHNLKTQVLKESDLVSNQLFTDVRNALALHKKGEKAFVSLPLEVPNTNQAAQQLPTISPHHVLPLEAYPRPDQTAWRLVDKADKEAQTKAFATRPINFQESFTMKKLWDPWAIRSYDNAHYLAVVMAFWGIHRMIDPFGTKKRDLEAIRARGADAPAPQALLNASRAAQRAEAENQSLLPLNPAPFNKTLDTPQFLLPTIPRVEKAKLY